VAAVTSRRNPIVARFRAAASGDASELMLLDGIHLVAEALNSGAEFREAAVVRSAVDRPEVAALHSRLRQSGVPLTGVSASVMQVLSPVRSTSPVVAIARRPTPASVGIYGSTPLVVIAVDIQDPGNLGAIVRVCEAAGVTGLVCTGSCADPYGWKALRGSMGSALRLPMAFSRSGEEATAEARRHGCRVFAASPRGGRSVFDTPLTGAAAVLVGGEGRGLTSSLVAGADERIAIPMQSPVESLNVAVSTALIAFEARRQRCAAANPSAGPGPFRSPSPFPLPPSP
jgi:TrmH family RNA methyltransferase